MRLVREHTRLRESFLRGPVQPFTLNHNGNWQPVATMEPGVGISSMVRLGEVDLTTSAQHTALRVRLSRNVGMRGLTG